MQFENRPPYQRNTLIIACAALLAVVLIVLLAFGAFGGRDRAMNYTKLRCMASQDVTPFGDRVLYYDGTTLYCMSAKGNELWSQPLGSGAGFAAGDKHLVAWVGSQLFIFDEDGHPTYNDHLGGEVQFARIGSRYVAAVVGAGISPTLVVKDMDGIDVDSEKDAYADMLILDVGFFSGGEYMWVTALDAYGTVPNNKMFTLRVGQMNTGEVSLGKPLVYKVLYCGNELNVITTRQLTQYDYRGTQDESGTKLVYGWQLIDAELSSGNAQLLFATSRQASGVDMNGISTLRLIFGDTDNQYTLPTSCAGAVLYRNRIYAFSHDSGYRTGFGERRFTALKLPMDERITEYLGMLDNGCVLLASGEDVYAMQLN